MAALAVSFLVSLIATLLIIRFQRLHHTFTSDNPLEGIHKFHAIPVPRVGGIGVGLGFLGGLLAKLFLEGPDVAETGIYLLACAIPTFLGGFLEDTTKRIPPKARLASTAISAVLAGSLLNMWIVRLDVPWLDPWLTEPLFECGVGQLRFVGLITLVFTAFSVTGVTNAYNLIDGYNGLAGIVAIIVLLGLAYVAVQVGDRTVMISALSLVGALTGFLIWNYPNGFIFLGDGGAYLIGFVIAELSILLVMQNPEVSPWFPLLLSGYPIFETIFSIWRKKVHRGISPSIPDGVHFHMLVYKRIVRWAIGSSKPVDLRNRNALTSPYLWVFSSLPIIPAVLLWYDTLALQIAGFFFMVLYVIWYRALVRFKVPKWITINKRRKR